MKSRDILQCEKGWNPNEHFKSIIWMIFPTERLIATYLRSSDKATSSLKSIRQRFQFINGIHHRRFPLSFPTQKCNWHFRLRLYEAKDTSCSECSRDMYKVVQDLQHIDTNCIVQAFTCHSVELDRCLQVLWSFLFLLFFGGLGWW